MTPDELKEVRERHDRDEELFAAEIFPDDADAVIEQLHADRDKLLAEIDRLRAENEKLRGDRGLLKETIDRAIDKGML